MEQKENVMTGGGAQSFNAIQLEPGAYRVPCLVLPCKGQPDFDAAMETLRKRIMAGHEGVSDIIIDALGNN